MFFDFYRVCGYYLPTIWSSKDLTHLWASGVQVCSSSWWTVTSCIQW